MYSNKEKRRISGGHNLIFKMWATKGARFVADERCKKIYSLSSFTIAFLSFEVIAISIYSLTGNFENIIESKVITALTLILSILFLVLSIFENAKNYNVKAKDYHNCGLEIGKVYSKLKLILAKNNNEDYNEQEELDILQKEYEDILDKYENHEEIDYLQFQVNKKNDFGTDYWKVKKNKISIYFESKFLYHFLVVIGPILLIAALYIKNSDGKETGVNETVQIETDRSVNGNDIQLFENEK